MKKMLIPSSAITYSQRHKNVVNSKANNVKGHPNATKLNLINLEQQVFARYNVFEQAIAQNMLFSLSEDLTLVTHKDDLLSCYKGRTNKVKEIFQLIEDTQPRRFLRLCPYCGLTIPKTHDHYLPETGFPELSVHVLNLIPCCGTCNQTKNRYWKNDNHRTFLHFYSDVIPDVQYLRVSLESTSTNAVGAIFSIHRPSNIQDSVWNVLAAHYKNLKLIEQYNENSNDEISTVLNSCVAHLQCDGNDLSKFIKIILMPEEQLYGRNHWRVVLMKALSTSAVFFACVNNHAI